MSYYWHHIWRRGEKEFEGQHCWDYLLSNSVITTSYDNELGDKGWIILNKKYQIGDGIFAYGSGNGLLGYAEISYKNYRYRTPEEVGRGRHLHELTVDWLHVIPRVQDAIPWHQAHAEGVSNRRLSSTVLQPETAARLLTLLR